MSQPPWPGNQPPHPQQQQPFAGQTQRIPQNQAPLQQPYPQQAPGRPPQGPAGPPRPAAATAAVVLGGLAALVLIGTAIYVAVTGIAHSNGAGSAFIVVLLAFIVGGLGLVFLLGAAALLHKRFPNPTGLFMGTIFIIALPALSLIRALIAGNNGGPDVTTVAISFSLVVLGVVLLILLTRPPVNQWIQATGQHSRKLGYVPRNERRQ